MIRSTSFRSAVQYSKGELALATLLNQALANGRAFIFGATASAIFVMVMGSPALAITNIATVVCGWAPTIGTVGTAFTVTELFSRPHPGAELTWTGAVPVRCARPMAAAGYEVRQLLDTAAGVRR